MQVTFVILFFYNEIFSHIISQHKTTTKIITAIASRDILMSAQQEISYKTKAVTYQFFLNVLISTK